MSRSSSGIVAGLTAAAIAVVGFLAYQASAHVPDTLAKPKTPRTAPSGSAGSPAQKPKDPKALPAESGEGERVVYALADRRVWLVEKSGRVMRTFPVMPSTVSPEAGSYQVTSRSGSVTGSDGVRIEHVVRFALVGDVAIGFSAAVDGTLSSPDPTLKTGGVRMKVADGNAMWTFATVGSKVVVVP
ncbi:L,D-transpeptidase [Streptomyces scopuliridis]|uniref:L,D-transpeptidase n=1 Tax=Streptomyces scopuliridis TaxID=452529 RepID=UPI0036A504AF